jgi:multidrug efflux pump subunit AcrB
VSITEFSLRRPAFVGAFFALLALLGALSASRLEITEHPVVSRPVVSVSVNYPGATAEVVEHDVLDPMEDRVLRLLDVQKVESRAQDGLMRLAVHFDFQTDIREASQSVRDAISGLGEVLPKQMEAPEIVESASAVDVVLPPDDGALRVRETTRGVLRSLLVGAILALLVVFAFLDSWRPAAIAGITILASALVTFLSLQAFGLGLNSITLLGIALGLGFLLDDAIAVRENITRHVELGSNARAAARAGTRELVRPLTLATMAVLLAFVHVAITRGVTARWIQPFALVMSVQLVVSLVASLALVPVLSAIRFGGGGASGGWRAFQRLLDRLTDGYHEALAWALDHRVVVTGVALGSLVLSATLHVTAGGTDFLPRRAGDASRRPIELSVQGPDALTLAGLAQRIADEVRLVPGIVDLELSSKVDSSETPFMHVSDDGDHVRALRIDHLDGKRVVTIRANLGDQSLLDVARDLEAKLAATPLPPGYRVTQSGDVAIQSEVFRRIAIALGVGIILIYVVLVTQFASFLEPLAIVIPMPLALVGGVVVLVLTGDSVDLYGILAGTLLMSLVARNATLLLEVARRRRMQGARARVALIEAARLRLRPILMTTGALVAVMLPLAISGPYASLARAVIGGAITTAMVTLLVVPCVSVTIVGRRSDPVRV